MDKNRERKADEGIEVELAKANQVIEELNNSLIDCRWILEKMKSEIMIVSNIVKSSAIIIENYLSGLCGKDDLKRVLHDLTDGMSNEIHEHHKEFNKTMMNVINLRNKNEA